MDMLESQLSRQWAQLSELELGEGARLYVEAMRSARAIGDCSTTGNLGGRASGIVRWPRPSLVELKRLSRGETAFARWREAARLGGPITTALDALNHAAERRENLDAAMWLVRVGLWKATRLRGARKVNWALEVMLDLLRSAQDLGIGAPIDQAIQASEIEILTLRELRAWAGAKQVTTELLDHALSEIRTLSPPAVDRKSWFANDASLRTKQATDQILNAPLAAAYTALIAVADLSPGIRPKIFDEQDYQVRLAYDASFAADHQLPSVDSINAEVSEREAEIFRELARATQVFDQRDTAIVATQAFFVVKAYQSRLGQYPTQLASAYHELNETPPIDPFSANGEPLRMRPGGGERLFGPGIDTPTATIRARSGQPLVYSVGPNGIDEDAAVVWDGTLQGGGDWVFPLPPHRPPRHWRQFDLRKAMVLMTLCCMLFAFTLSAPQRQARALRTIRAAGGSFTFASTVNQPWRSFACRTLGSDQFGIVTAVDVDSAIVDDRMMAHISQFTEIQSLDAAGSELGRSGLRSLGRLKNLVSLNLSHSIFSNQESFKYLAGMDKLEQLDFEDSNFNKVGMRNLPTLKSLTSLDLNNAPVTGEGFAQLAKRLPQLSSLVLYSCPVTDDALVDVGKMNSLTHLDLDGTKITDAGMIHLARMTNLETLDIQRTALGDDALQHLAGMKSLVTLLLNETQVKGPGLAHLAEMPALMDLGLESTPLDSSAVKPLLALKRLSTINLENSTMKPLDVQRLRAGGVKNLEYSAEFDITDLLRNSEALEDLLARIKELQKQAVTGEPNVPSTASP